MYSLSYQASTKAMWPAPSELGYGENGQKLIEIIRKALYVYTVSSETNITTDSMPCAYMRTCTVIGFKI